MTNYGDDWRDTDFGEGQERYYGNLQVPPPSGPPGGPPPPVERGGGGGGRGRGALIGGVAALAVAVAAGGIYVAMRGGDETSSAEPTSSTQVSGSGTRPPQPEASTGGTEQATSTHKASVAGWRVADGNDEYPVIFDVPPESETFEDADKRSRPEWQITTESDRTFGFFDPRIGLRPLATTKFPATYRLGHCATASGNALAFLGFYKTTGEAAAAASAASEKFLKAMSLKENGTDRVKYTEGKPKTVKVDGGKTSAVRIRTDVPWSRSDPDFCVKGERELVVTSVPTSRGTGTIIASRVKSGQGVLDEKTFEKMLDSIRPRD